MPIDIDEFEAASEDELMREGSTIRDAVIEYLAYNPRQAHSREEIQSALGVDGIALVSELATLEHEGLVRHKGRYWAIAADYESDGEMTFGEPL